jgi:glutamate synthase domain-containing protein 2
MSYGAISIPALRVLSRGAKLASCWLNTWEGGLSPYHLEGSCDLVFQIGTVKYGVRDREGRLSEEKLRKLAVTPQIKMFEIKLSQGAKPGKWSILPGAKVTDEVATIRGIPIGQDAVSPNRHLEISNFSELLDFINLIRGLTGKPVISKPSSAPMTGSMRCVTRSINTALHFADKGQCLMHRVIK